MRTCGVRNTEFSLVPLVFLPLLDGEISNSSSSSAIFAAGGDPSSNWVGSSSSRKPTPSSLKSVIFADEPSLCICWTVILTTCAINEQLSVLIGHPEKAANRTASISSILSPKASSSPSRCTNERASYEKILLYQNSVIIRNGKNKLRSLDSKFPQCRRYCCCHRQQLMQSIWQYLDKCICNIHFNNNLGDMQKSLTNALVV